MTPHIQALLGDYADTVLMPGDPVRSKWIADNFFENVKCVNTIRNCFGYTGTYKGKKISTQASGMGQPSLGIYANELFKFYGVETIIRIGTCGSFQSNVACHDIVIPKYSFAEGKISQSADCNDDILKNVIISLDQKQLHYHIGSLVSVDTYYQDIPDWFLKYANIGVLGVDMETYMLYNIADKYKKRALTVNLVSDNLVTSNDIGQLRVTGVKEMVESVLDSLVL